MSGTAAGTSRPEQPLLWAATDREDFLLLASRRLEIRALGQLKVELNGEPLALPRRSRELLLYLVCNPDGVELDEVADALWSGHGPEQARSAFHVAVHRLRRRLGHHCWIEVSGTRCRVTPDATVHFDLREFELSAERALILARRDDDEADAALAVAVAMYRGEFGADQQLGEWANAERSRHVQRLVQCRLALASRQMLDGDTDAAEAGYLLALESDPASIEACTRLMIIAARQGLPGRAAEMHANLIAGLRNADRLPEAEAVNKLLARIESGERM